MFDKKDLDERFRDTRKFRAIPTPACLNYLEAKAFPSIAPERRYHVAVCNYCSVMVKTVIRPGQFGSAGFFGKLFRSVKDYFFGKR